MEQVTAYEELVRNGRLAKMSVDEILRLIEPIEKWVRNLEKFDDDYKKKSKQIAERLRQTNLAFSSEFSKKSPTPAQVLRFRELSGITWLKYTDAKIRSAKYALPARQYSLDMKRTLLLSLQNSSTCAARFEYLPRNSGAQ